MNGDLPKTIVRKQSPKQITSFGMRAASQLIDIVKQNKWNVNIQGNDYLRFEAWQTVGRFFGYTVKTDKTNYVEYGDAKGFEASSTILDANGQIVGGAEAVCMDDERQWSSKPLYALKSMAQTRASARALRQILSWVVVLAGYKPTPVEEIGTEIEEEIKKQNGNGFSTSHKVGNGKCPECFAVGKIHAPNCSEGKRINLGKHPYEGETIPVEEYDK